MAVCKLCIIYCVLELILVQRSGGNWGTRLQGMIIVLLMLRSFRYWMSMSPLQTSL